MNLRERNKRNKYIILSLLLIGISLGYAMITSQLKITGLSKINNASWDIHFDNVVVNTNSVEIEDDNVSSAAVIDPNDNTKVSFHVKLKEPGDFYEFTVDAVNDGSMDAMVDTVVSKLNNQIINELPSYLIYTTTLENGDEIRTNHLLAANTSETYKIRVEFSKEIDEEDLPDEDVSLNFDFQVNFKQKDESLENLVNYQVKHRYQNYDLTTYTEVVENLQGEAGSSVTPNISPREGFNNPSTQTVQISSEGNTIVTYTYSRKSYHFSITDRTYIDNTSTADGDYLYETPIVIKAIERGGYQFEWSDGNSDYERIIPLKSNLELTPIYTEKEPVEYKVVHKTMNLDGVNYTVRDEETLSGVENTTVTPSVKTYEGFTSPSTQTVTINGDGSTIVEYLYTRNKVLLTLEDSEYIETTTPSGEYYYDTVITLRAKTRDNYTFLKWSNDEDSVEITFNLKENTTISPIYQKNSYRITLNPNGGSVEPTSIVVNRGESISELPVPVQSGYYTIGWFMGIESGIQIEEGYTPENDMEIFARWRVSVEAMEIENSSISIEVGEDETINITNSNTIQEDYTFTSSNLSIATVDSTGKVSGISQGITTITITGESSGKMKTIPVEVTLPAITKYRITLNPNGGSVSPNYIEVEDGEEIGTIPTPSNGTNLFDGWYTASTGGVEIDSHYVPEGNIEVFARWYSSNTVAVMDNTGYTSLANALEQVPTTGEQKTIKILKDIEERSVIAEGKNVILNLNNKTISTTTANKVITNNGTITIKNGTMSGTATNVILNNGSANLLIKNCTITCSAGSGAVDNKPSGVLTIEDTRIEATGTRQALYNEGTSTIKGNSILSSTATERATVHNKTNGTINILGGTIQSSNLYAVYNESGTINIGTKDGSIKNTPVIEGKTYGLIANTKYNFYDGIIKGETYSIGSSGTGNTPSISNDTNHSKINSIEDNSTLTDGVDNNYKTLYLESLGETYTVTLNPNGGSVTPTSIRVAENSEVGELPTPEKDLHDFVGWYTGIDTGIEVTSTYIITADIEIFARYTKKPVYTITYDTDGGSSIDDKEILQGASIGELPTPTKTGLTLEGWYLETTYQTKVDEYYTPTSNITLHAKWTNSTFLKVFEQIGECTFNGSSSNITGSGCQKYLDKKYIDTGINLYNEENHDKDYEIHLEIVNYDPSLQVKQATLMNTKLESTGYPGVVFRRKDETDNLEIGSRKTSGANEVYLVDYSSVSSISIFRIGGEIYYSVNGADKVLLNNLSEYNPVFNLPVWFGAAPGNPAATTQQRYFVGTLKNMYIKLGTYQEEGKYRITYNTNGGDTLTPNYKNVVEGEVIGTLPTPTRSGYYFDGWYTSLMDGIKINSSYTPEGDMEIVAKWKKSVASIITNPEEVNITEPEEEITINITNTNEIEESYTFTSSDTSIAIVDSNGKVSGVAEGETSIKITGSTSGQVKEVPVIVRYPRYTITFDSNGGREVNSITVVKSMPIGELPEAYLDHYFFDGWYTGLTDGIKVTSSYVPQGDMKLFAHYISAPSYTITFDVNGGEAIDETSRVVSADMAIGELPTPTRASFYFDGWKDEAENKFYTSNMQPTKDVTLKAEWSEVEHVARINSTYYPSIQSAIDAAQTDYEIILLVDRTEDITNNKKVTLNLNKHEVIGYITNNTNGDLTLLNGSIKYSGDNSSHKIVIQNYGILTIGSINPKLDDGVLIENTNTISDYIYGIYGYRNSIINMNGGSITATGTGSTSRAYGINGYSTITMNGGSITATTSGYNSSGINGYENSIININGGSITATGTGSTSYASGIDGYGNSIINMNGGSITATGTGSSCNAYGIMGDNVTMNGGSITATGTCSISNVYGIYGYGNSTITMTDGIIYSKGKNKESTHGIDAPTKIYPAGKTLYNETSTDNYEVYYLVPTSGGVTVTFNPNGGSVFPTSMSKTSGENIGTLPTPTRENYDFDGWYNGNDKVTSSYVVNSNVTLTAHWIEKPQFTITFDKNNNAATGVMNGQTIYRDATSSITQNTFVADGYQFIGWNTKANGRGTSYLDGDDISLTKDITLYAQWVKTYTLTFDKNDQDATGDSYSIAVVSGVSTQIPDEAFSTYTLAGKRIDSYNSEVNNTGTSYYQGQSISITTDTIIYAHWKVEEAIFAPGQTFNATIKQLSGSSGATYSTTNSNITSFTKYTGTITQQLLENATIVSSDDSDADIYAWFDNGTIYWYTECSEIYFNTDCSNMFYNLNGLEELDFSEFDFSNITTTSSMLTNMSNLNTLITPIVNSTTSITLPKTFMDSSDSTYTSITSSTTTELTLKVPYTITFDSSDGERIASTCTQTGSITTRQIYPGNSLGTLPTITAIKTNYIANGWTDEDETQTITAETIPIGDTTYYVKWIKQGNWVGSNEISFDDSNSLTNCQDVQCVINYIADNLKERRVSVNGN